MSLHEIVLPETKPETEWVRGRAVQKVSPTYWHASLQMLISGKMGDWAYAGDHGRVGTEWRFRVAPPGEIVRPLVPDVAFLSYETIARDATPETFQVSLATPTVAVEILSPDDRPHDVADKIATYMRAGTRAILIVDPARDTVAVHDGDGNRNFRVGQTLTHEALPGFSLDIRALFERAKK